MNFSYKLKRCALPFVVVGVSVILHGCGGGGDVTTSTATTTTTTGTSVTTTAATTTTATTHAPVDPMPWQDALKMLNDLYTGWDPKNSSTEFGVTIRFLHSVHILNDHDWFYCQEKCTKGLADCRVSASLLNNHTMIRNQIPFNASMPSYAQGYDTMMVGVAFNQTWIENVAGKCYYQFDGASEYRYNHGCGCGAEQDVWNCNSPQSPYSNIDPKTGQQMNAASDKVAGCHCGDGRYVPKPTPATTVDSQCFWKGPAFDPSADSVNELPNMMEDRMKHQHGVDVVQDQNRSRLAYWNEVVIDGNLLTQQLADDPSKAFFAIVYRTTGNNLHDGNSHDYAHKFANYVRDKYHFTQPPPVIGFDTFSVDVRNHGPFFPHASLLDKEPVIA